MKSGKKPEMRLPPGRAGAVSIEDKMRDLDKVGEWAQAPAMSDAENAGLKLTESRQEEISGAGEGEDQPLTIGKPLKPSAGKREKKNVGHLVQLDAELNDRIESLLDQIPRSSKRRMIIHAIEEYVTRVERAIQKSNSSKTR